MRKMFAVNGLCEMVKLSETSIDIIHRSLMPIYGIYKRGINVNDMSWHFKHLTFSQLGGLVLFYNIEGIKEIYKFSNFWYEK